MGEEAEGSGAKEGEEAEGSGAEEPKAEDEDDDVVLVPTWSDVVTAKKPAKTTAKATAKTTDKATAKTTDKATAKTTDKATAKTTDKAKDPDPAIPSPAERAWAEAVQVARQSIDGLLARAGWPGVDVVAAACRDGGLEIESVDGAERCIRPYELAKKVCALGVVHTLVQLAEQQLPLPENRRAPCYDGNLLQSALTQVGGCPDSLIETVPAVYAVYQEMVGMGPAISSEKLADTAREDAAEPGEVALLEDAPDWARVRLTTRAVDHQIGAMEAVMADPFDDGAIERLRKAARITKSLGAALDAEPPMDLNRLDDVPADGPPLRGAQTDLQWQPALALAGEPQAAPAALTQAPALEGEALVGEALVGEALVGEAPADEALALALVGEDPAPKRPRMTDDLDG